MCADSFRKPSEDTPAGRRQGSAEDGTAEPRKSAPSDHRESAHTEAVLRLFMQHQRWLFSYLMTLLGNPDDAEDVMQEVSVVMWREHANFELGTNFVGWLSVIAYHQVQKFWRQRRKSESYLDAAVIEQLATTFQQDIEAVDIRRHFLNECLQALGRRDRAMIESVYNHSQNRIREVAQEFGQEESRFYRALAKIRRGLLGCVQRKMIAEGISL